MCHTCKEKIKTCPLCRQTLVGRNVAAEHISNKLLRHCANQDAGCKELVSLDSKEYHEQICSFRKYECLAGKIKWLNFCINVLLCVMFAMVVWNQSIFLKF